MLSGLTVEDQDRLVEAMQIIEGLLGSQPGHKVPYLLRPHQPGDMGWVVHRHGVLYAQEYGWNEQFEALVAGIVAEFIKLRLLLVEPKAREIGIGTRRVNECVRFARQTGYQKITLWTNSVLHAARHIYEKTGFRLVHEESHHSFGHDLIGETWELVL